MTFSTSYLVHYSDGQETDGYRGNVCFSQLTRTWNQRNLCATFSVEKITYLVINYGRISDIGYNAGGNTNTYNDIFLHTTSEERFKRNKTTRPTFTDEEITQYLTKIQELFHPFTFEKVDDFVWQVEVPNIYGTTTTLVACLTWIRHIQETPAVIHKVLENNPTTYTELLNCESSVSGGGGHGINGYSNKRITRDLNIDNLHLSSLINNQDKTLLNINNTYTGTYHV